MLAVVGLLAIGVLAFTLITPTGQAEKTKVTVHKSSSCGCCGLHSRYLEQQGFSVGVNEMPDVTPIKDEMGIPTHLRSCHTAVIGDYYIEGHMPIEAINKLMAEKPDVAGIALPGMPSGSPGMPGSKQGEFVIYSINKDGTSQEFLKI
ncbi:MAG: DUF411 domain-containing protein [DPANN group archaeon]|nr:DUF411 domain-containing protein [DPANN group archaeon]